MYAGIQDLKLPNLKPAKFSTDHYGSEYDNNIDFLAVLKDEAPQQYHALMHNLYKDLVYALPPSLSLVHLPPVDADPPGA